eukprot:1245872-Alexandrium_andersonii.AAC.1
MQVSLSAYLKPLSWLTPADGTRGALDGRPSDRPPRNPFGDTQNYVRLPSGVWCVQDSSGRRYPVDYDGGRWTNRRLEQPLALERRRPAEAPTEVRRQMSARQH